MNKIMCCALLVIISGMIFMTSNVTAKPSPSPVNVCQQPSPPIDIFSLIPMLTKSGLITAAMNKSEQELIIKNHIKQQDKVYHQCLSDAKSTSLCNRKTLSQVQIEAKLLDDGIISTETTPESKQLSIEEYRHFIESDHRLCLLKQGAMQ